MGTVVMKSISFQSTSGTCFWCGKLLSRLSVTCMTPCLQSSFWQVSFYSTINPENFSRWISSGLLLYLLPLAALSCRSVSWHNSHSSMEFLCDCIWSHSGVHLWYSGTGPFCWSAEPLRVVKYGTTSCSAVNPQPRWKHYSLSIRGQLNLPWN